MSVVFCGGRNYGQRCALEGGCETDVDHTLTRSIVRFNANSALKIISVASQCSKLRAFYKKYSVPTPFDETPSVLGKRETY